MRELWEHRYLLGAGWAVLCALVFLPQKILSEDRNPLSRFLEWLYNPAFAFVMRFRRLVIFLAIAIVSITVWPFLHLGKEFMPPLEEGDLLYMPTTDPGISMTKARELLQQTDKLIKQFPEVKSVLDAFRSCTKLAGGSRTIACLKRALALRGVIGSDLVAPGTPRLEGAVAAQFDEAFEGILALSRERIGAPWVSIVGGGERGA